MNTFILTFDWRAHIYFLPVTVELSFVSATLNIFELIISTYKIAASVIVRILPPRSLVILLSAAAPPATSDAARHYRDLARPPRRAHCLTPHTPSHAARQAACQLNAR